MKFYRFANHWTCGLLLKLVKMKWRHCSSVWHLLGTFLKFCHILWRAARFVLYDYSRNSSVSAMLAGLNWQSLEERRIINKLTMFYKIRSYSVNISFPAEISLGFRGTRKSHDCKFMPLSASVNTYKYSFFPRTIPVCNGLPFSVVHASSVNLFKACIVLNKCYFISFLFLSAACVICYSSPQYIQFNVICICLA